jgi:hypothetical protein
LSAPEQTQTLAVIITVIAAGIAADTEIPFVKKKNAPRKKVRNVLTKEIVKKAIAQGHIVAATAGGDIVVQGYGDTGIAKAAAATTMRTTIITAMAIITIAAVAINPICR